MNSNHGSSVVTVRPRRRENNVSGGFLQFTDRPSPKVGLSAPGLWLTVELTVGSSDLGFG
jgi:hypothetical protein